MSEPTQYRSKTRAIMFSDIKGYSRMMGENESLALRLLDEHNRIVVPTIEANGGTVLKFIGDAVLSTYESAADAVRCGIAIQKALAERNATAPPDHQILIRIGIHVGDVVLKDNDAFGDGVNIAARIEPLAEPGGIAISQTVYDMVKARPEIQLVNLGPKELKNIKEAVNIYKVLLEANAATATAEKPPAKKLPFPLPVAVGVGVGIIGAAALLLRPAPKPPEPPAPVAVEKPAESDVSSNKEAALAFKQGMQAFSDGASALPLLRRALEKDETLAAASLHLALELRQRDVTQARANFRQTVMNREHLPEFDKALFAASDPYFFDPPNFDEWEKRLVELAAKFPNEPRAGYYLGEARRLSGQLDAALSAFRGAHQATPSFAPAYAREAQVLRLQGKGSEANATLEQCTRSAPYGIVCVVERANAASDAGECDKFLEYARKAVTLSPDSYVSYMLLAAALQSTGQPLDAVRAALAQKRKYGTEAPAWDEAADRIRLAMLEGDFETVISLATESMTAAEAGSSDLAKLSLPAHWLAEAYEELGDRKGLGEVADRFLADAGAFTANSLAVTGDLALARLEFERHRLTAGKSDRSRLEAARTAYLDGQKEQGGMTGALAQAWAQGFGVAAQTKADAVAAVAAEASFGPAPPGGWDPVAARLAGKVKLLAGQAADAIPLLQRGARACNALKYPHENTRAWLRLGEALAATGDRDGAREAWQVVLKRWGESKKSASAQEARSRLAALGR